jgi:hypothetical protein
MHRRTFALTHSSKVAVVNSGDNTLKPITQRRGNGCGTLEKKALYKLVGSLLSVIQKRGKEEVKDLC